MKLKRPIAFGLEVAAGLILATAGAWVANKFSHKANRQAQAEERTAVAAERIADALTRPPTHRDNFRIIERPAPVPDPCDEREIALGASCTFRQSDIKFSILDVADMKR